MCGIVGFAEPDLDPVQAEARVRRMCDAIHHRGPDDAGWFVGHDVALGVRRLSIIDLPGGHQPIANETGELTIVFNGEIYNYPELRDALLARGHVFKTHTDTETILHLYEDKGPRCVDQLRGMFAFGIHDRRDGSLFLARDRFGIKPLYLARTAGGIGFSSELKALVSAGLISRELDWMALDEFFELGYIPAPRSPFVDVAKLEPGHWALWHPDRGVRTERYWDLPRHTVRPSAHPERDVAAALDDAVRAHLVSDVPVAAFLSGGLDSSAVVSSMARQTKDAPHAFTARYRGSGSHGTDETPLARALADRYGVRLTIVDIAPQVGDVFERIVHALDEPHADESAIPSWHVSEAIAADYKVALSGTGGDELFAGYRRHIGLLLGDRYRRLPLAVRRAVAWGSDRLPEPRNGSRAVNRLKRFTASSGSRSWERYLDYSTRLSSERRASLYVPELRARLAGMGAAETFEHLHAAGGQRTGVRAGLYLDYKTYLPDDILALSDRIAMAHSLEVRVPFVDHVLVEQVFPLPDRVKVGMGRPKLLLRKVLADRLPQQHLRAPKRGFVGPTATWLRNELRPMLTDQLSPARIQRLGYFDHSAVAGLMDEHFSHRSDRAGVLWALLCFMTWHDLYVEGSGEAVHRSEGTLPARIA